jgi:hypothetical protein
VSGNQKTISLIITAVDQTTAAIQSIRQQLGTLNKSMMGTATAATGASQAVDKKTKSMADSGKQTQQAAKNMDDFEKTTGRTSISVASLAAQLAVLGMAVAAVHFPVKAAADFEHTMAQVGAVSQTTGATLEALSDFAMEMGQKTLYSATEAADGDRKSTRLNSSHSYGLLASRMPSSA